MKCIRSDPRTSQLLDVWKGSEPLLRSDFYFWAARSDVPKSFQGLLRSILYSLLEQHQHFIPLVFPDVCRTIQSERPIDTALTISELTLALRLLVEGCRPIKICLFIDGLDEYSGDHRELVSQIGDLSVYSQVKFMVSSRPWPVFEEAFKNKEHLLLEKVAALLTRERCGQLCDFAFTSS